MIRLSYAYRVRRGVKFLDKHLGRDVWLDRVYASRVDVDSGYYCVLAQATLTTFWGATSQLGLGTSGLRALRTYSLGFIEHASDNTDGLTSKWRETIYALQSTRVT